MSYPTLIPQFPTSELPTDTCPLCQQRPLPHGDWACDPCKESWQSEGVLIQEGRAALAAAIEDIERASKPAPPTALSAAMRAGSLLRPQAFREYFMRHPGGEVRSCALGAAWEALGGVVPDADAVPGITGKPEDWHTFASRLKLALLARWPARPWDGPWYGGETPDAQYSLWNYITMYLNDRLSLSREEIADWLESVGL
jgi:hypothetical protein